jgi:hypothetical protein
MGLIEILYDNIQRKRRLRKRRAELCDYVNKKNGVDCNLQGIEIFIIDDITDHVSKRKMGGALLSVITFLSIILVMWGAGVSLYDNDTVTVIILFFLIAIPAGLYFIWLSGIGDECERAVKEYDYDPYIRAARSGYCNTILELSKHVDPRIKKKKVWIASISYQAMSRNTYIKDVETLIKKHEDDIWGLIETYYGISI